MFDWFKSKPKAPSRPASRAAPAAGSALKVAPSARPNSIEAEIAEARDAFMKRSPDATAVLRKWLSEGADHNNKSGS